MKTIRDELGDMSDSLHALGERMNEHDKIISEQRSDIKLMNNALNCTSAMADVLADKVGTLASEQLSNEKSLCDMADLVEAIDTRTQNLSIRTDECYHAVFDDPDLVTEQAEIRKRLTALEAEQISNEKCMGKLVERIDAANAGRMIVDRRVAELKLSHGRRIEALEAQEPEQKLWKATVEKTINDLDARLKAIEALPPQPKPGPEPKKFEPGEYAGLYTKKGSMLMVGDCKITSISIVDNTGDAKMVRTSYDQPYVWFVDAKDVVSVWK